MTKLKIVSLFVLILISTTSYAQGISEAEREQAEIELLMDKYTWLYEILMPAEYKSKDKEAKKSFSVHLRDSVDEFPHPGKMKSLPLASKATRFKVRGNMTYVGFFPKPYRYDVERLTDGSFQFLVYVYFKNATQEQFVSMQKKIQQAQDMWNRNRYDFGIPYQFQFVATKDIKKSHFRVQLKAKTRGPYDTNWSLGWSYVSIAHEIGHMLGLGDEYQTLTSKIDCIERSLMCSGPRHLPFHHYHVLRRLYIPAAISH